MSDNQCKDGRGAWLGCTIMGVLLVLPAYVLSTGPVLLLWKRGYFGGWVNWFYAPLRYCYANLEPVAAFFDWYLSLWGAD